MSHKQNYYFFFSFSSLMAMYYLWLRTKEQIQKAKKTQKTTQNRQQTTKYKNREAVNKIS